MIYELETMCADYNFDKCKALELISNIDVNQEFVPNECWFKSNLLTRASEYANIDMVRLLLENGACPNQICDDDTPLWDLQYPDPEIEGSSERRLKITQLLLEYGANPNIQTECHSEELFPYVLFTVLNDDFDELWKYRSKFLILLLAYGGKTTGCIPKTLQTFDRSKIISDYRFYRTPRDSEPFVGVICDNTGEIVAYL